MFGQLNLSKEVLEALESGSFLIPTEIQNLCIPLIAEGKDVMGRSQTGTGKTFAFGLPIIDKINAEEEGIEALIICPTRELALQVTDELKKVTKFKKGCSVVPVYGGSNISRQIVALKRAKIVVGTPGRLMDHIDRRTLKLGHIKTVVLDEADEMLNMGFRDDIETILKSTPSQRQTVMFSATMPPEIKEITRKYMINPEYIEIGKNNTPIDDLEQSFIQVMRNQKKEALLEFFETFKPERTIIFCNTKRMTDEISKFLNLRGHEALALHGDMRQNERKRVMSTIKSSVNFILVASDVAARGIDIKDVEYVINFDLPKDVEYYIHRIGRTGRAGKSGKTVSIINGKDQLDLINSFKATTGSKINEIKLSMSVEGYVDMALSQRDSRKYSMSTILNMPGKNRSSSSYRTSSRSTDGYKKSRADTQTSRVSEEGDKGSKFSRPKSDYFKKKDGEKNNFDERKNIGERKAGRFSNNRSTGSSYFKKKDGEKNNFVERKDGVKSSFGERKKVERKEGGFSHSRKTFASYSEWNKENENTFGIGLQKPKEEKTSRKPTNNFTANSDDL